MTKKSCEVQRNETGVFRDIVADFFAFPKQLSVSLSLYLLLVLRCWSRHND